MWRKENVGERKYANVHLEEKLSTFSLNLLFSSGLSSLSKIFSNKDFSHLKSLPDHISLQILRLFYKC